MGGKRIGARGDCGKGVDVFFMDRCFIVVVMGQPSATVIFRSPAVKGRIFFLSCVDVCACLVCSVAVCV